MSTSQITTTEHHPALVHHFDDMEQQKEASTFGMWVFLLTELMMFGGLFTAYMIYRLKFYEAFVAGSRSISVSWGFANTLVLLGSSFTMAMAVWAAQQGKRPVLGTELEPSVFALEAGQVTEPIRVGENFIIVKLVDRGPSRIPPYEQSKQQVLQLKQTEILLRERKKWLDELKQRTHIVVRM